MWWQRKRFAYRPSEADRLEQLDERSIQKQLSRYFNESAANGRTLLASRRLPQGTALPIPPEQRIISIGNQRYDFRRQKVPAPLGTYVPGRDLGPYCRFDVQFEGE